jgi:hypothetical protein
MVNNNNVSRETFIKICKSLWIIKNIGGIIILCGVNI